jgi:murein DD-endopeptidase MepM/ murein hydrolase activator NlpD
MKKTFCVLAMVFLFYSSIGAWGAEPRTHVISYGETLYSISRKYDVPFEALVAVNRIKDPSKLSAGTTLIIPTVHIVVKGETLFGISRHYGITIRELLDANKLSAGYVLKIGDMLVVPASETTTVVKVVPTTNSVATTVPKPATTTIMSTTTIKTNATVITTTTTSGTEAQTKSIASSTTTIVPPTSTVPMPETIKTQDKVVDMKVSWPAEGKAVYLDGKLEGVMIRVKPGEVSKAIASGTVVSAGPSRGFGQVAFVQAKSGYVYVYGGNENLMVKAGDQIVSGKEIGKVGIDAKDGSPIVYFFVFRNGQPVDPALAPRD